MGGDGISCSGSRCDRCRAGFGGNYVRAGSDGGGDLGVGSRAVVVGTIGIGGVGGASGCVGDGAAGGNWKADSAGDGVGGPAGESCDRREGDNTCGWVVTPAVGCCDSG